MPDCLAVTALRLYDCFVRITLDTGTSLDFHYVWLRHNCPCCIHPETKERVLCASEIDLAIRPKDIQHNEKEIIIIWDTPESPHQSRFSLDWLEAKAYSKNRKAVLAPSNKHSDICIDFNAFSSDTEFAHACVHGLTQNGATYAKNYPHDTESLISLFSKENLALVGSHFGRIEDLKTDNKTNMHTDQLGYTNAAVDFHTDQPFIENTPRFQMLHCIQVADQGGESGIANAKQAALYLKSIDPNAFDILCQTPVTFHRKQHAFESIRKGPLITLRGEDVYQVRFSYFTMAPHTLPFDQMIPWYQAYRRYINLVKDPRHHYSFQLQKGEFVLYDNFIMFHARKAFTGSRWMKGVYFTPKSTP